MGPSGFLVIIESQAIMVSTWAAIGKLIHALEVWSDVPRLPNIEPLQHEPSTADSTAIQRCIGQYSALALCPRGVVLYCNTALYILQLYSALHSTALYNPPQVRVCCVCLTPSASAEYPLRSPEGRGAVGVVTDVGAKKMRKGQLL